MDPEREFAKIAEQISRIQAGEVSLRWYPYDTLANLDHLRKLLGNDALSRLASLASGGPCLDVGTGDGHLAFALVAGLGLKIHAVDWALTNHNGCHGFRLLQQRLGSGVELIEADLDKPIPFPLDRYPLALCLGVLYHASNPIGLLRQLAERCDHMILSTRVCQPPSNQAASVAYLLGDDELNSDNSNYWLFTEPALEKLMRRCDFAVQAKYVVSSKAKKSRWPFNEDIRVFMLLRSESGLRHLRLESGWHSPEEGQAWRWTARRFSATVPRAASPKRLEMRVYLPEGWASHQHPLALRIRIDGRDHQFAWMEPGEKRLAIPLAVPRDPAGWKLEASVDRPSGSEPVDQRDLGIIVASCAVLPA